MLNLQFCNERHSNRHGYSVNPAGQDTNRLLVSHIICRNFHDAFLGTDVTSNT